MGYIEPRAFVNLTVPQCASIDTLLSRIFPSGKLRAERNGCKVDNHRTRQEQNMAIAVGCPSGSSASSPIASSSISQGPSAARHLLLWVWTLRHLLEEGGMFIGCSSFSGPLFSRRWPLYLGTPFRTFRSPPRRTRFLVSGMRRIVA